MSARALTCAVVSADSGFVEALRSSALFESGDFRVDAEIQAPYSDITDVDLQKLRSLAPDIVILDLESNFSIGLKFAEFLGDEKIGGVMVASGPPQSPEMLMDVMHAGVADFIPKPITSEAIEKAMKNARRKLGKPKTSEERDAWSGDRLLQRQGRYRLHDGMHEHQRGRVSSLPEENAAPGPGPRARRVGAATRRGAAFQHGRPGPELPSGRHGPTRLVHRTSQVRHRPTVSALQTRPISRP